MSGYQSENNALTDEPLPEPPTPSGYDEKRAKKNLHLAYFIILMVLAGLAGFSGFLNFCMSMSQVSSTTVLADGSSIWKDTFTSCKNLTTFVPLRWEFATQRDLMMICPWPAGNSAFRSLMSIVAMADLVLFVFAIKKSENTIINWSFIGSCGLIAVMYLIIIIVDGSRLTNSNKFCADGMPQMLALIRPEIVAGNASIGCFAEPFTGTMFSSVLCLIVFPGFAAYFIYYQRRSHKEGESTIPSDDETKPLTSEPKKKVFVASAINDESLTQDVTGANPFDPKTGMIDPDSA